MDAGRGPLDEVLDRQAIQDQITNYARSVDRLDHALGRAVFHPEAEVDYGAIFQGTGWGFIDWCLRAHLDLVSHSHQFSNVSVVLEGSQARSETYADVTVRMRTPDGATLILRTLGRYIDRWEKRDGAWRIRHRKYRHDMDYGVRPDTVDASPMTGRRDRTDASYFADPSPGPA